MASVGFGGRVDHDAVNAYIAHMRGVKEAVGDHGREVLAKARANFAPHNRPGGHQVVSARQDTDFLVILEGPVPWVLEFGREGYTTKTGAFVGASQPLYILSRAADL